VLRKSLSLFMLTLAFVFAASFASADLTGTWAFQVDVAGMGGGTPTVELQQDAEGNLTGHYNGQMGSAPLKGKISGEEFEFQIANDMGSITYKGALQLDGSLKGKLDLAGMAEGTFTAKKSG
jgi:hypothetical protein